jgi:DNA topoisomerase-3
VPTVTGIALIDALPVASLASPELTGSWEARLARIARGEDSRASFMADIARYVADTVDAIRGAPPPAAPPPGSAPPPAQRFARGSTRGRQSRSGGSKDRWRTGGGESKRRANPARDSHRTDTTAKRRGKDRGDRFDGNVDQRRDEYTLVEPGCPADIRSRSGGSGVEEPRRDRPRGRDESLSAGIHESMVLDAMRDALESTARRTDTANVCLPNGPARPVFVTRRSEAGSGIEGVRIDGTPPSSSKRTRVPKADRTARKPRTLAPGSSLDLSCPACKQATLIAGARGWGCARWREGCRFVIWFETAGRRVTAAQLQALVTRGKTRKATFEPTRGQPREGRLVLDPSSTSGAARFEPA